jgi:hypothetical protein
MALPNAPRLKTYSFVIPDGQILVLAETTKRTYFAMLRTLDKQGDIGHLWIGPDMPTDIAEWIPMEQTTSPNVRYDHGVYGPIYIAMSGVGDGGILIQSNLHEEDYASFANAGRNSVFDAKFIAGDFTQFLNLDNVELS